MILVAAFGAFFGMMFLNGLPHPHHPVFNVPQFARSSQDRFFLCIEATDPRFDLAATAEFLASLAAGGTGHCRADRVVPLPMEQVPEGEDRCNGMQEVRHCVV